VQPIIPAPGPNGRWRVLILDRDPADPKWILATIATPDEIRPAHPCPVLSHGATMKEVCHGEAGSWVDTKRQRPGPADGQGRGAVLCGMRVRSRHGAPRDSHRHWRLRAQYPRDDDLVGAP
jgi:hypothetical protein